MARRGRRSEIEEAAEPNLTPLIDVVFVILIIFIVVAPILELDRVRLAGGRDANPDRIDVRESGQVAIHVHEDDTIWLDRRQIDPSRLEEELMKRDKEGTVQLFHDRSARFGTYQLVKNAVEAAGFEELDVILEPR